MTMILTKKEQTKEQRNSIQVKSTLLNNSGEIGIKFNTFKKNPIFINIQVINFLEKEIEFYLILDSINIQIVNNLP